MDPKACSLGNIDQSEHGTCALHNEMEVDNTEQAERVPEHLLVEDKFIQELNLANQKLDLNMSELARVQNVYMLLGQESHIKISQLQKEKDDLEANCRQIIDTLEAERNERRTHVSKLQSEKEDIKIRCQQIMQSLETERKNSKAQISKLQSEKEDLNTRLIEEQKTTSNYRAVIDNHIKIIERISSEEPLKCLSDENDQLKKQIISMKDEYKVQTGKLKSLQKQNLSLESTLSSERKQRGEEINRIHRKLTVEIEKLTEDLMKAVQEKDDLTIRLSKLASASLTHNNPNIADLSDPYRPTKLAEAFSELYDNEWTDAFEKMKNDDEVKTVINLLTMLQKAYEFSVSLSEQALVDIKGTYTRILFNIKKHQPERVHDSFVNDPITSEQNNVNNNDSDATTVNSQDDKTITFPAENCENTITVETNTGHVHVMDIQDTEKRMPTSQKNLLKKETQHDNVTGKHQDNGSKNNAQHTQIPICATDEKVKSEMEITTVTFDLEDLQPNEKQLISDIRKRVLNDIKDQIVSMILNAVVAEMNLHACENSIFTYVKACASICWKMRIHQPPVCLEFVEIDDQTPFNTAIYKHYTKSGQRLDYVVWPALYLHKGGPLLSKGVAQGK